MIDHEFRRLCQILSDRDGRRRGVFIGKNGLLYLEFCKPGIAYSWRTIERKRRPAVKAA